jgi:hypothetical protein
LISLHGFEMTKRTILAELTEHALAPKDKKRRGCFADQFEERAAAQSIAVVAGKLARGARPQAG